MAFAGNKALSSGQGCIKFSDGKKEASARIIRECLQKPVRRLMVAGSGIGIEASILAEELGTKVLGIDLEASFDPTVARVADFRHGDAAKLEFGDGPFDFVLSYHAFDYLIGSR